MNKRIETYKGKNKIYEGKAKIIYEGYEEGTYIQYFKDDATAFNNKKKGSFKNKGYLNNLISSHLMTKLNDEGFQTHFIKKINDRNQLVKKVNIIPIEVVARNWAAGSIVKRLGLKLGDELKNSTKPLVEFYYKDDSLNDPLISESHIEFLKLIHKYQITHLKVTTHQINSFLLSFFNNIGIKLIDYKLEFGFDNNENIILADEISPDTCRLWDIETNKILDKDRFRQELGGETDAYTEVARRMNLL